MSIQADIETILTQALQPEHLEVVNESYMHNVPPDSETHFKVTVVTPAFADMRRVARHQKIYGLLSEQLAGPVHALALHTYTGQEWHERAAAAPNSPECLGGGKGG